MYVPLCESEVTKHLALDFNCLSKGIVRVWGLIILSGDFYSQGHWFKPRLCCPKLKVACRAVVRAQTQNCVLALEYRSRKWHLLAYWHWFFQTESRRELKQRFSNSSLWKVKSARLPLVGADLQRIKCRAKQV